MNATSRKRKPPARTATVKKGNTMTAAVAPPKRNARAARERVLVEFPVSLLERADRAAKELDQNRSDLIRTAVEKLLEAREREQLETELAEAYAANAKMNIGLVNEFAHVDKEGFR